MSVSAYRRKLSNTNGKKMEHEMEAEGTIATRKKGLHVNV